MSHDGFVNRRSFLHRLGGGLAAAGLGGVSVPAPALAGGRRDERKLGWAIVGLGSYATRQIMPRMRDCQHSRLVALVSGSPDKARKLAAEYGLDAKNIYNYQNFDSIRDNPDIDIVYVVLPNSMHHEYTIRALRAGKHVMCEKPMAVSARECEEMIAEARRADRKLMIGYRSRFEPYNVHAIELARREEFGPTRIIETSSGFSIGDPEQWRLKRALSGGGSLMDIGIYSVQAARYLTGEEPVEVTAMAHSTPGDPRFREVEENINFQLRFPSGVLANAVSSYGSSHNRYRLTGTRGWLEVEPATGYEGHAMRVRRAGKVEAVVLPPPARNQFVGQLDHLSECVLHDREPLVSGEEGLRDLLVMEAIYRAAETGQTVRVGA